MKNSELETKLIPYEPKDQDYLVKIVTDVIQGYVVSNNLLNLLSEEMSVPDNDVFIWKMKQCDSSGVNIGFVIVQQVNYEHRTAQLVVLFEDSKNYQNYALLNNIYKDVAKYVFWDLDINRLEIEVLENNLTLKKGFKKMGFHEEGLLRNKYLVKNKFYDAFILSMLKIEWERSYC